MNEPDTTGIWILMDVCSTYEQLPEWLNFLGITQIVLTLRLLPA